MPLTSSVGSIKKLHQRATSDETSSQFAGTVKRGTADNEMVVMASKTTSSKYSGTPTSIGGPWLSWNPSPGNLCGSEFRCSNFKGHYPDCVHDASIGNILKRQMVVSRAGFQHPSCTAVTTAGFWLASAPGSVEGDGGFVTLIPAAKRGFEPNVHCIATTDWCSSHDMVYCIHIVDDVLEGAKPSVEPQAPVNDQTTAAPIWHAV
ncbi:hypothetical protein LZ30DRAFT_7147 [Colletotrichum cereale]|nr:hypothetical protein LZ30DRAFT_7147 [Colletotrichum cereale]